MSTTPEPFEPDAIMSKEECLRRAQAQLRLAENVSGDWGMARALTAIGYLWLGDSQPEVRTYTPSTGPG
jgi:hypothetical protein